MCGPVYHGQYVVQRPLHQFLALIAGETGESGVALDDATLLLFVRGCHYTTPSPWVAWASSDPSCEKSFASCKYSMISLVLVRSSWMLSL